MNEQVPFWWVVVALFIPPVLSLLGVAVAQGWQDRREHSKWLREQRLEVYGDCLSVISNYHKHLVSAESNGRRPDLMPDILRMRDRLDLVGSVEAQSSLFRVIGSIGEVNSVEQALREEHGSIPPATGPQDPLIKVLNDFEGARENFSAVVRKELQGKLG